MPRPLRTTEPVKGPANRTSAAYRPIMTSHNDSRTDTSTPSTDAPHSESEDVRKDTAYTPGSESETQQKQDEQVSDDVSDDIDPSQVQVAPGTGGPDDVGEIEVDPKDINLPGF